MSIYADMCSRALSDEAYRDGLRDAAHIARANDNEELARLYPNNPPCPASMAAVYIERVSEGQDPHL